ncbi:MAG: tetratricopeptide repeat protein, partial [Patescibacteria group bacterium]|nr:tetratricopeptide repeat protein [Patescibacteria group bacterium]
QKLFSVTDHPDTNLYSELGDVYLYTGTLDKAIENYRNALSINPVSTALQKKLGLALSWNNEDDEAFSLLSPLYEQYPEDREITLEIIRIYSRKKDFQKALSLLRIILTKYPDDPSFMVELGDCEASLGHAVIARQLYLNTLRVQRSDDELLLRIADRMNMWGDFYKIEELYLKYLRTHPG